MRFIEVKVRDENFYDALAAMLKAIGHEMTEDEIMDKVKLLSLADVTDLFDAIENNDVKDVMYYMDIQDTNEYKSPSNVMGDRDPGQASIRSRDRLDKGRYTPQKSTVAGGRKMPTGGAYNDADQAVEPGSAIDRPDQPDYLTVTTSTGDQNTIQSPVGISRIKRLAGIR